MSIKKLLELKFYNGETSQWEQGAYKTIASAVDTKDGSDVQSELDAIPGKISAAVESVKAEAISEVTGSAPEAGNTLGKLYEALESIKTLLNADDQSLDTLQEIVDYIKTNRDDLTLIGSNKVNYTDIVNSLDTVGTIEGKVLDARQGKVLKDAQDNLELMIAELEEKSDGFASKLQLSEIESETQSKLTALETATQEQLTTMQSTMRPVISDTPPSNPTDGQLWFMPVSSTNN